MSRTKIFFLASPQNLPPVVTSVTRVTPHVGINLQISLSFSKFWTRGFNILDNYWKWVENVVSLQREEWSKTASKWQDIDKQKWIQTRLLLSISVEKDRIRPFVLLLISSPICSDLCCNCRYICPKHPRIHTFSSEHLLRTKKWCIFQPQTITISVKIILSKRRLRWTYR